ncbi:MAG TPA: pyruvate dehydrogenase (acetyl-transferring) E1 component subunit alpha [Steroidobacteraceae bacterium]|nr:pyruvate dehydrogenase (acetyl-transferring) E1 component subunit alpha [Steroidobacteraceae bacterium]
MNAAPPAPVTRERGLHLLREMLRIRCFEDRCVQLYGELKIRGFLHLCNGEEAVAVGTMQALEPADAVISTYREHGHAIARGLAMNPLMAEMYGKESGTSRGRGGSMHIFDAHKRFYGGNAIVGGGLPLALGLALAQKLKRTSGVTACLFGDGAVAEGEFHESLNLAALWRLPLLFLCENNLYAMGTAIELAEARTDVSARARDYGLAAWSVDGMDVFAVEDAARNAVAHVRGGQGPVFLELRTYRFRGHSMFDAQLYRDKAEIEAWQKKGPLITLTTRLKELGLMDETDYQRLEGEARAEVEAAVDFAERSGFEPLAELERFVYAEPNRV